MTDPATELEALLKAMVKHDASDLFITAGFPPSFKIHGKVMPASQRPLSESQAKELVFTAMTSQQQQEFSQTHEGNFALGRENLGRFRVNAFYQRSSAGMVLRRIKTEIPSFEQIHLPATLCQLTMISRGMVIFVGGTGSGKSTSLAAMVGYRNRNSKGHIVTIEDPIEYIHEHEGCIITQREVGIDTQSYEVALKNTLRQAPDVILIGEIRSRETMEYAMAFAETGHLCLSTLHANNANQALERIINFFPEDRRRQLLLDLSLNLKAVVAQRLIPTADGKGRRAAVEILINTPLIAELIYKGDVVGIKDLMKRSTEQGMQSFDKAVYQLYKDGAISYEDALRNADSANEVRLMVKLGGEGAAQKLSAAIEGVTLQGPE
ncbi:PilT/PilU family type 4a pilus ATPase [Nitrosococcus wardiae]|uniref:PilT/PilU family type 4a pilus ATPase n=1 Tax=Nitrosococcus wardiae TaxID=1814290 RepID=A0A4P7BWG3_9GAMM|nr:PilT/PilU family type 4a pilus ATPase [Nitrosococcus wardiae]QBQ53647.1 PilT/PilU family type 4a pilus ATPase [Nitrosococcus wardiae]